jgi:hypothetical protein
MNHCPRSFRDEVGPPHLIDAHLAVNHPPVYESNSYCSELHLQLASLIGVGLTVRNRNTWKCPFEYCEDTGRITNIAARI